MKLYLEITTAPSSFDAEDEIENALMDGGLKGDLESAIEQEIQQLMRWTDIHVSVEIQETPQ